MLIKHGLKMNSRALQERTKMPKDAQLDSTLGQHGANMRFKISAKNGPNGLEVWSWGGLKLESLPDPNMDFK